MKFTEYRVWSTFEPFKVVDQVGNWLNGSGRFTWGNYQHRDGFEIKGNSHCLRERVYGSKKSDLKIESQKNP